VEQDRFLPHPWLFTFYYPLHHLMLFNLSSWKVIK